MQQQVLRRQVSSSSAGSSGERIMGRLQQRLGPHKFAMWFAQARVSVQGQRIEIATNSPFAARWIDANFCGDIAHAARDIVGCDVTVEVIVTTDIAAKGGLLESVSGTSSTGSDSKRPHVAQNGTSGERGREERGGAASPARGKPSFARRSLDRFVVGASNQLAYAAARRLAENADGRLHSPLFVHGPCGVGKTHLLQGACRRFTERWPSAKVRYVPAEQFTNEFIAAVRNDKIDDLRRRVRKLDFFAIDDVHFFSSKMRTQTEFLYTLDAIAMSGARVMLASDGHPRQIASFNQALVSRFMSGMVVQIDLPDRDMRSELVKRIAGERGMTLSDPAVDAVANRCVGSARELEGAVAQLAALRELADADQRGGPVGLLMVEQLFGSKGVVNGCGAGATGPVRFADVLDAVCERLGVGRADLMGSGRHHRIVLARGVVAHLAREMTTMSYPEIAQVMGRKHHSTIHTAAKRLARQIANGERVPSAGRTGRDIAVADLVDQLRHEVVRSRGRRA